MDRWDDIFKSFFNIPKNPNSSVDDWVFMDDDYNTDQQDGSQDSDYGGDDPFHHRGGGGFTFRFTEPDEMLRHFEEMFRDLGMAEFPPLGGGRRSEIPSQEHTSPRDYMLKDKNQKPSISTPTPDTQHPLPDKPSIFKHLWKSPKWDRIRPQEKVDKELDPTDKTILDDIVKGSKQQDSEMIPHNIQPGFQSMFQSVSIKTVRRPDGSVEHIKTVRGSDGKEETTVTRSSGDQTHSVTTVKTKDEAESFTNLDENNLKNFNSLWSNGQSKNMNPMTPRLEERDEETQSIFKNLFGFSLPGYRST